MTVTRTLSGSVSEPTLYVAFELGKKEWKVAMTSGFGVPPWLRTVASRDWRGVARVIAEGRARFGLCPVAPVVSCYEAGRDGFWIHRALVEQGIQNRVVDSASIEVNRRARRGVMGLGRELERGGWMVRGWFWEPPGWRAGWGSSDCGENARRGRRGRTELTSSP